VPALLVGPERFKLARCMSKKGRDLPCPRPSFVPQPNGVLKGTAKPPPIDSSRLGVINILGLTLVTPYTINIVDLRDLFEKIIWHQASNYLSAFASQIGPGPFRPRDLRPGCMRPKAIYISLPVQPGSQSDVEQGGGGSFPLGDERRPVTGAGYLERGGVSIDSFSFRGDLCRRRSIRIWPVAP
jgi:hypothetical protein